MSEENIAIVRHSMLADAEAAKDPADQGTRVVVPQEPLGGCWDGILHEFRNHLTLLLAGTTELRSTLPRALGADFAEALGDMETSVHLLESLMVLMDAVLRPARSTVTEISDIFRRAVAIAGPSLRPWIAVQTEARPATVHNRGALLESAIAALLAELARAPELRMEPVTRPLGPITLGCEMKDGSLVVRIACPGVQPPVSSWRSRLARHMLLELPVVLEPAKNEAGWTLQLP